MKWQHNTEHHITLVPRFRYERPYVFSQAKGHARYGGRTAIYALMPYATVSSVRLSFSMSCFIRSIGIGEPAAIPVLSSRRVALTSALPMPPQKRFALTGGGAYRRSVPRPCVAGPLRGRLESGLGHRAAPCIAPPRWRPLLRAGRISRRGRGCKTRVSTRPGYLGRGVNTTNYVCQLAGSRGKIERVLIKAVEQWRDVAYSNVSAEFTRIRGESAYRECPLVLAACISRLPGRCSGGYDALTDHVSISYV